MQSRQLVRRIRERAPRAIHRPWIFVFLLLVTEFIDELVFGAREAAWPYIRNDLQLSYAQVGLLLGVPAVLASFIEPLIGVLGDLRDRRLLIVAGGFGFALGSLLTALAPSYLTLMFAFVLFYPASGAFVSLSQASLMDVEPHRHEQLMARWTMVGSLGVVAGPLALGAATWLGAGWRSLFLLFAVLSLVVAVALWRSPFPRPAQHEAPPGLREGLRAAGRALVQREVLRWLALLECSNFMLDVLLGFLALYFVDVVGTTPGVAGIAVAVWVTVGLVGDILLIPLLERVRGLSYLRLSASLMLLIYPAFLLAPGLPLKVGLLGAMGLLNAGWYAILQGQLYSALPGRSGTAMAVSSVSGILTGFIPAVFGLIASRAGLDAMMWLLLLGPVALLVGIPFRRSGRVT